MPKTIDCIVASYRIEITPYFPDQIPLNGYIKKLGDTMHLILANGYYKMDHINGSIGSTVYNYHQNTQYQILPEGDTAFIYNCSEEHRVINNLRRFDSTVNSKDCQCQELRTSETCYIYCKYLNNIEIEVDNFKNHDFGFYNQIMTFLNGPYSFYELKYHTFSIQYTLLNFKSIKVPIDSLYATH